MNIWPWSTIRKLRDALADAKREATLWETSYERRAQAYDELLRKNANLEDLRKVLERHVFSEIAVNDGLRAQLAEAAKNDTRDPKTGRFVKAER